MEARVEIITPEKAKEYLKCNVVNRPLNKARVEYYAKQMREGKWSLNGEGIQFVENGALGNGQHRLSAIIVADTPIQMLVVRGADNNSLATYDQGKMRSAADVFKLNGVHNANKLSSIVNRYAYLCATEFSSFTSSTKRNGYSVTNKTGVAKMSVGDLYDLYLRNSELFDKIEKMASSVASKTHFITASDIGGMAAYLILVNKHDEDFVFGFFSILGNMSNTTNVTINTLRIKLYNDKTSTKKMTPMYKSQIIIKAWNAFATGKELKVLAWNEEKEGKLKFI